MLSHHIGSPDIQGQIHLMPDYMKGLDTVALNNAFEHALEISWDNFLVRPGCQTAHAYSRTERMTEQ